MERTKLTFFDYILIFFNWRKTILLSVIIVSISAAGISLMIPKWFTAKTIILPPSDDNAGLGMSSLLNKLPIGGLNFGLGLGTISNEANRFLAILNSRTVLESVVKKFDLQKRFKKNTMAETRKQLKDLITVEINEDGTLSIDVKSKTPWFSSKQDEIEAKNLCTNIANYIVFKLDKMNSRLKGEKARNSRIFIEKRYNQNLKDLEKAEEALNKFQKQNGVIEITEQMKALISAAAELKIKIISKEIELGVMKKYLDSSHSERQRLVFELDELQKKYDQIENGYGAKIAGANNSSISDFFAPLNKMPDLALQYFRLFREVKLQEALRQFLFPQYEQAKIQEKKDTPTLQVLDSAVLPELKSKPKRAIFVTIAASSTLLISILLILMYEQILRLKKYDPEKYHQIYSLRLKAKKDLLFWKRH